MILNQRNALTNNILLINVVFAFLPISFIFGNLIININIVLFCCLGIFYLRSKILTIQFEFSIKIIFLFFFIIFFSTSLSFIKSLYLEEYEYYDLIKLVKSIAFFRFFLMLVIINLLSKFSILNFKYFFLSAALTPLLVSLDVIFQYIFGFDMVGYKNLALHSSYNSGFFGDELIAGGFIENFSFLSILFLVFVLKNKNDFRFILITFVICILGAGILLSGNRLPLFSFLTGLILIFLINKNLKKILLTNFLVLFVIFGFIYSFDSKIKNSYLSFFKNVKSVLFIQTGILKGAKPSVVFEAEYFDTSIARAPIPERNIFQDVKAPWQRFLSSPNWDEGQSLIDDFEFLWVTQNSNAAHSKIFSTALDVWAKNKIFGNGIKSFRKDCKKFLLYKRDRLCSTHPHNYYIEILTETGIVGLFITLIIGLLFVVFVFKNFRFLRENNIKNFLLLAATISLFLEVFPIQSTGSIFSTHNMTYLTLITSILLIFNKLSKIRNPIFFATNKDETY